jgi:hypothetical protein
MTLKKKWKVAAISCAIGLCSVGQRYIIPAAEKRQWCRPAHPKETVGGTRAVQRT